MLEMNEIRLGKGGNIRARSELETELDEVIESLEEAAKEIEKLAWENEEQAPAN
jgi:molybdenum-dependent DNA-binding transcriptional regulator ModE